jgi:mono/diheme cytochrome c family protein
MHLARRWLKRLLKVAGFGLIGLVLLLSVAITLTTGWRPITGAKARALTERKFERTPARMERGRYLVEGVAACFACHSEVDWNSPGAPVAAGKKGAGRVWTLEEMPWLVAPNITPDKETGAGDWSDDALARAIREGIGHDGRALFPIMPYSFYRQMSDEDLASTVVYLRSVAPVRHALPQTKIPFPLSRLIQNAPQPLGAPVAAPDMSEAAKRGAYLATLATCTDCHTPKDRGEPLAGMEFAGGFILNEPGRNVASANITPDATGISYYDEALFIEMIRTGHVKARQLSPVMPWISYRDMTDEDLKSIFAYLRSLKPIRHHVDNTETPSPCKLCRQQHGLGNRN